MTTTPATPAEVAKEIFAAIQAHDLDRMGTLDHDGVVDDFVAIGRFEGRDQVRGFFAELLAAFPDFEITVDHIVCEGENAVVQWHCSGTFTGGPFQGVHATGRSVELRGVDVMLVQDGLRRSNTVYYDGLAFARQVGMLPSKDSAGDKAITAAFNARTDVMRRLPLPGRR